MIVISKGLGCYFYGVGEVKVRVKDILETSCNPQDSPATRNVDNFEVEKP